MRPQTRVELVGHYSNSDGWGHFSDTTRALDGSEVDVEASNADWATLRLLTDIARVAARGLGVTKCVLGNRNAFPRAIRARGVRAFLAPELRACHHMVRNVGHREAPRHRGRIETGRRAVGFCRPLATSELIRGSARPLAAGRRSGLTRKGFEDATGASRIDSGTSIASR